MNTFITRTLAVINSDKAEEIANQNFRKANAAFRSQVAGLESQIVDAENAVENARTAFNAAITPKTQITNNVSYMQNIVAARDGVNAAEVKLAELRSELAYFNSLSGEYFTVTEG